MNNGPTHDYKYRKINYFASLNGLRFIAAFLVVMHHSETIRHKYGLPDLESFTLFRNGTNSVTFFFVLSGFLITYLLLKEHLEHKTISIRNFYMRRIFRIWPLYFLIIFTGIVLVPVLIKMIHFNYVMPYTFKDVWYYYLLFLPFVVNFKFGHNLLEPTWSIGVEEIFYLVWAPLVKLFRNYLPYVLTGIIFLKYSLSFFHWSPFAGNIFYSLQFESMATGGLGAYLLFNSTRKIEDSFLFKKPAQVFFFTLLFLKITLEDRLLQMLHTDQVFRSYLFTSLFSNLIYLYTIVCTSVNTKSILKLRGKLWDELGDISYGIYMYHMMIVFGTMLFLKSRLEHMGIFAGSVVYYSAVTTGVLSVAYVSKKTFENYFLKLKAKYK